MKVFIGILLAGLMMVGAVAEEGPYMATGIKIGEVTSAEALVWIRLTKNPARMPEGSGMPKVYYKDPATGELLDLEKQRDKVPVVKYPEGVTVATIEGAAPGMEGDVRVQYRSIYDTAWKSFEWLPVLPDRDYTRQFHLRGLYPNRKYEVRVSSRSKDGAVGASMLGSFLTAPAKDDDSARVRFMVTTGTRYTDRDAGEDGFKMYDSMLKLAPSFFVHTGDILYYDQLAKNIALARWHWQRMYSFPSNKRFHSQVSSYFIKDDHDTWWNDCWPSQKTPWMGDFTFKQGQAVFLEQVPMKSKKTYRTIRWGKDLQIWLVEGRDYRTPNDLPDGPDKYIWGKEQMDWFKRTVQASDATFRVLISPTPVVGPDRTSKNDNHSNINYTYVGSRLRKFIASQKNMVTVCGDRHWQYVSVDETTGLREYSCGPATDEHAGGWTNDMRMPQHQYLNVIGGFLAVTVERIDGVPTLIARHHGVDGEVLNEDKVVAE